MTKYRNIQFQSTENQILWSRFYKSVVSNLWVMTPLTIQKTFVLQFLTIEKSQLWVSNENNFVVVNRHNLTNWIKGLQYLEGWEPLP